jgi:putative ABC transport system substrate-binding protein
MMRRSVVIAGLAALLLAPERSAAQQTQSKIPRAGILSVADSERAPMFDAFREGLRDLGYVEGRNIILEFRFAHGDLSLGPQLAAELVALPADVIVVEGLLDAAVAASGHIPIVSPVMMNPVERGFASSIARPGANITGFTLMQTELNAKRLELLRTAFPHITAVTALVNPSAPAHKLAFEQTESAARSMGLGSIARVEAESAAALRALRPAAFSGASAVVVVPDGVVLYVPARCRRARQCGAFARDLPRARICRGRRLDVLRGECAGQLPPGGRLRRPDFEGREPRRLALPGAGEIRLRRLPKDRE